MTSAGKSEHFKSEDHVDNILENIGGFGRYQVFKFSTITVGSASGALVLYALYYFEKFPAYLCTFKDGTFDSCTNE